MHVNVCAGHYGKEEDPDLVLPTSLCSSHEGRILWGLIPSLGFHTSGEGKVCTGGYVRPLIIEPVSTAHCVYGLGLFGHWHSWSCV